MTMREKMARTMYERMRSRLPSFDAAEQVHAWENQGPELRADWIATTDAALDALMEPTEGMIEDGINEKIERISDHLTRDILWFEFRAMIRAAKEGK